MHAYSIYMHILYTHTCIIHVHMLFSAPPRALEGNTAVIVVWYDFCKFFFDLFHTVLPSDLF